MKRSVQKYQEILRWIKGYHAGIGFYPTYKEIAKGFGVSVSTIQEHLLNMRERELIEWPKGVGRAFTFPRER